MYELAVCAQLIIALSIAIVWIFRFQNVSTEFKEYHLSEVVRSLVGAAKISLATLLIAGIWYPKLVFVPALLMALLMLCAQGAHFKVRHPFHKYLASLSLLILSVFVAWVHSGTALL